MAVAKLNLPPISIPQATGLDATTPEGKLEQSFRQWASAIVRALQLGTVDIPETAAASSAAAASVPSAAELAALAVPGPVTPATPMGPAGGDLSGTYPNPKVVKINGKAPGNIIYSNLADILAAVSGVGVPSGIIAMWSGLLATIPPGWFLCDGTNGTPDLRSNFIQGATNDGDIGTTGGANHHKHALAAGGATAAISSVSAGTPAGTVSAPTFTGSASTAASVAANPHLVASDVSGTGVAPITTPLGSVSAPTFTGTPMGTHTHALSGDTEDLTTLPPWYKLFFIMKG